VWLLPSLLLLLLLPNCVTVIDVWNAAAEISPPQERARRVRWGDAVGARAARPAAHDVLTSFAGEPVLVRSLERNEARPLSLASADFDEDGVPDLVGGYSNAGGGILSINRGNVDSIYPNAPEARRRKADRSYTDAPFLAPASVFTVGGSPDFVGAGDFDGDGHWDVVTAGRGERVLYWLAGDGQGRLGGARRIELPGAVTALTVGENNRADGLADVIVGVADEQGAKVLTFEGPEGALQSAPEVFAVPAVVTALALGQFDDEYTGDLAVASGNDLLVFHGRDRKLSQDREAQATVKAAVVSRRSFPSAIRSLTAGDFIEGQQTDIALLDEDGVVRVLSRGREADGTEEVNEARAQTQELSDWYSETTTLEAGAGSHLFSAYMSGSSNDDLMAFDPAEDGLRVINSPTRGGNSDTMTEKSSARVKTSLQSSGREVIPAGGELLAVLPMRLDADALSDLVVLRKGHPTPAVALTRRHAGLSGGLRGSSFAPDNLGGYVGALPLAPSLAQTFTVVNTNNSGPGSLRQALLDANANAGADTIVFSIGTGLKTIASASTLPVITDAVTIDGTTQPGFAGQPIIELTGFGLSITAGRSVVRGLVLNRRAGIRIEMNGGNIVEGNYIGTDATGTIFMRDAGFENLDILSSNNTVGGTTEAARNVISGAFDIGDHIIHTVTGNVVQGNFIGTNATGTAALIVNGAVNVSDGLVLQSTNNIIGGSAAGARNVISGNAHSGIWLLASGFPGEKGGNLVQGNLIGTNVTGTTALRNTTNHPSSGIIVNNTDENTIGGTTVAARNIISGNPFNAGVSVGGSSDNLIQGNFIGTDITGLRRLGNGGEGVSIFSGIGNTVGGATAGARNIISGNSAGVFIRGQFFPGGGGTPTTKTKVQGNFIGTDASGTVSIPNRNGVQVTIDDDVADNTIGGATLGTGNLISGNDLHGIAIGLKFNVDDGQEVTGGTGILVQGNVIGTDASGLYPLGNLQSGVFVDADSFTNTIADNIVAHNGQNGVFIPANNNPGVRIALDNNRIFSNEGLGIDLGDAGVTPNDAGDPDTGANFLQNFPVLTSATSAASLSDAAHANRAMSGRLGTVNVRGTLNSTPNTSFTLHWYFSADQQCSDNQAASRPLVTGKVPGVATDAAGNASFDFPFTFPGGHTGGVINCTATDSAGNTSEFSSCLKVVDATAPPTLQFSVSNYNVNEADGSVQVTVMRTGNPGGAVSVNFATANGAATDQSDYTASLGTLRFATGEMQKSFNVIVTDDAFVEPQETFNLSLSNPSGGAGVGAPSSATVTINSEDSTPPTPATNPLDGARFLVGQHYADFLGRVPDAGGLEFWTKEITDCGTDAQCAEDKRINVSAAFFLSIEFQETGYLVYRLRKSAFGNLPGRPVPVRLREFLADTRQIGQGVQVGLGDWAAQLEANKNAFALEFVQRPDFGDLYPQTMSPAQFVDALNANAGGALQQAERDQLVGDLTVAGNTAQGRAVTLRRVAEDEDLRRVELNKAFVLTQYFGYMRRNPDDAPDTDFRGWQFWLKKLEDNQGNFIRAEMVKAFISSLEYRGRFGPA
jgi:hypothetical protein